MHFPNRYLHAAIDTRKCPALQSRPAVSCRANLNETRFALCAAIVLKRSCIPMQKLGDQEIPLWMLALIKGLVWWGSATEQA